MRFRLVLLMLVCLALADCAQGSSSSKDDNHSRFGGFYGGVGGGVEQ
jgi:hypothetical protein